MGLPRRLACDRSSFSFKCSLIVFNIIFAVCGIALICVAVIPFSRSEVTDQHSVVVRVLVIVGGVCALLATIPGCCGAGKESRNLLLSYVACLVVLLILQLTSAVLAFVDSPDVDIDKALQSLFRKASNNIPWAKSLTNDLQQSFQCCGYNGPTSWSPQPPPVSCCSSGTSGSLCQIFENGCKPLVQAYIRKYVQCIGIVCSVVAVVECVGIGLALAQTRSVMVKAERKLSLTSVSKRPLQAARGAKPAEVQTSEEQALPLEEITAQTATANTS